MHTSMHAWAFHLYVSMHARVHIRMFICVSTHVMHGQRGPQTFQYVLVVVTHSTCIWQRSKGHLVLMAVSPANRGLPGSGARTHIASAANTSVYNVQKQVAAIQPQRKEGTSHGGVCEFS